LLLAASLADGQLTLNGAGMIADAGVRYCSPDGVLLLSR
jgi:hypothetical protein